MTLVTGAIAVSWLSLFAPCLTKDLPIEEKDIRVLTECWLEAIHCHHHQGTHNGHQGRNKEILAQAGIELQGSIGKVECVGQW